MVFVRFFSRLPGKISYYYHYVISGFANGGSWKLHRITELDCRETRKIMVRNMSTYEEIFTRK